VNDAYGHESGDELLVAVSLHMKEALREGDTLARIGGDEFVAVLADLEQMTDCEEVLIRLLQAVADPVTVGDTILQVSASIGVTLYPQHGADAGQLMRQADQAMYIAKQGGKNRYHLFDADHDTAVQAGYESLKRIRRALELSEFVLYYQPQVNMKTGEVIGTEALIRWQHPERGLMPPADFLPIIENHPIGIELGEWVIDTVLTQMSEWLTSGLNIPVSVNIGCRQLQQADFVIRLSALLALHPDIQPCSLELEVLETSAFADMAAVSAKVQACRDIGMHIALDDFGTGYSSLTYLKHLPIDMLKIDQSFVRDMLDDPDDLAIFQAVISLAKAFHCNVIAECVETFAHSTRLLSMGCELGQGYGIARPMPAADLPGWVANWKQDADWTV
jgi:diguanylate cyclase (GGDEF)-like protein